MSYHRVLPVPGPLQSNLRPGQSEPQSLPQHDRASMANEKATTTSKRGRSPVSPHRSPSPVADRAQTSPRSTSLEDYVDSPKDRARAGSQVSNGGRPRLPSISKAWPVESPSDICLCQPDPKVPRPRNGTQLFLIMGITHFVSDLFNMRIREYDCG